MILWAGRHILAYTGAYGLSLGNIFPSKEPKIISPSPIPTYVLAIALRAMLKYFSECCILLNYMALINALGRDKAANQISLNLDVIILFHPFSP